MSDLSGSVLLLGTDSQLSSGIASMLEAAGLTVEGTESSGRASELERTPCELAVVDLESSGEPSGLSLVRAFTQSYPDVPVVALGKQAGVSDVVDAVKAGAADFLGKPVAEQDLLHAVKKALAAVARSEPNPPSPPATGSALLGDSEPMLRVRDLIRRVATGTATVLIRGESGTGKDARRSFDPRGSGRSDGPYVKIHCAALPER